MAVESQPTELSSLSNMFIDYAEVGEVEVETSEMKPCSNSSNVQPVALGTFVERARLGCRFKLLVIVRMSSLVLLKCFALV